MAGLFGKHAPAQPGEPTFLGTLDRVLGGMTITEARADQRAAAQKQQIMSQLLDLVGGGYQAAPPPTVAAPTASLPMPTGDVGDVNIGLPKVESQSAPYTYTPPQRTAPVPISDPRWRVMSLLAPMAGVKLDNLLKVEELNKPQYVNNMRVNLMDPNAPAYIPQMDKNQEPLFDSRGNIVGVRNLDGSVNAAAEMTGAVEGAKAKAQAPYQFTTFEGPNGEKIVGSNAALAGQVFRGQSPAAAEAAKMQSQARTQAQMALPGLQDQATQTLSIIDALLQNPALDKRTGAYSMLPAIPGSPGAAFDALHDQLAGKVFMQAYSTLKGGGQITEVEGKKATAAFARLNRAQSPEDYKSALTDLRSVIETGLQRAQQAASVPAVGGQGIRPDRAAVAAELRRRGLLQ